MTWRRIDESTYIDETLVTCAEYQLFIDEMREKGKFYQPDHWTSNQFPEGQAREPILGVRHSDALAFCEWLTLREDGQWKFRLPSFLDATKHQLEVSAYNLIGYWIIAPDPDAEFFWIGQTPENLRALDVSRNTDFGTYLRHNLDDMFQNNPFADVLSRSQLLDGSVQFFNKGDLDYMAANALALLHERIAGRSPAFEGIRLVKERIK